MTTPDGTVDLVRDRELVERCQRGDQTAFAELYTRYHRRLNRFCFRRLHATDDAEEAVQEAFTRAWRAMPRFAGERRFYPWLTVIAGNVCTDMLRRRSRLVPMDEVPHHSSEVAGSEFDVDEQLIRQVDLAMAAEALGHLSDRHQRVLRLREGTEWSAQRIAEVEGVAVPAVDTLLWRARQAFKREFAALTDTGGFAALLGAGVAALRRIVARAWLRTASYLPAQVRGPGAIAVTIALTGAAIAGGSAAIAGTGAPHRAMQDGAVPARATGAVPASSPGSSGGAVPASAGGDTATGSGHGAGTSAGTLAGAAGVVSTGSTGLGSVLGGGGTAGTPTGGGSSTTLGQVVSSIGGLLTTGSGGTGGTGGSSGPALSTSATGALGTGLPGATSLGSLGTTVTGVTGTSSPTTTGVTGTSSPTTTGTTGTSSPTTTGTTDTTGLAGTIASTTTTLGASA